MVLFSSQTQIILVAKCGDGKTWPVERERMKNGSSKGAKLGRRERH